MLFALLLTSASSSLPPALFLTVSWRGSCDRWPAVHVACSQGVQVLCLAPAVQSAERCVQGLEEKVKQAEDVLKQMSSTADCRTADLKKAESVSRAAGYTRAQLTNCLAARKQKHNAVYVSLSFLAFSAKSNLNLALHPLCPLVM